VDWNLLKGSTLISAGMVLARILGFAFSFVLARAFSPSEYGLIEYAIALAGVVAIGVQPFSQHTMARFISKNQDDPILVAQTVASSWVILLATVAVTFAISVPILIWQGELNLGIYVIFLGFTLFYTYWGFARGYLASGRLIIAYLTSNLVQIVLTVLLIVVLNIHSSVLALSIYGFSYFIPLVVLQIIRPFPLHLKLSLVKWDVVKTLLRFSVPIWISHAAYMLYSAIDLILLERLSTHEVLGVYSLNKILSSIFLFVPTGVSTVLMPRIAASPHKRHLHILSQTLLLSLACNLLILAIYLLLGNWFIRNTLGESYVADPEVFIILAVGMIVFGLHSVTTAMLVGTGLARYETYSRLVALAVTLGLGLILVPRYQAFGTAVAVLAGSSAALIVYGLIAIWIYRRKRLDITKQAVVVPITGDQPEVVPAPAVEAEPVLNVGEPSSEPRSQPVNWAASSNSQPPAIVLGTHTMGLGVIRALGENGIPIVAVYYNSSDVGYVSRYVKERIFAPHPEKDENALIDLLVSLADRYPGAVLYPVADEALVAVSRNKPRLEGSFRVACAEWDVVQRVIDKRYTYDLAEKIGIPTPKTLIPHSLEDVECYAGVIEYPSLIKPCKSHEYQERFHKKMVWAHKLDELIAAYQEAAGAGMEVMLQEYIPGPDSQGVNYNTYCFEGRPIVEFTAQKVRSGPPVIGSPCVLYSDTIEGVLEPGRKLLNALEYSGYACTEFKQDPRTGEYKLMEVNARHNLSTLLAVRSGLNFPLLHYRHLVEGCLPMADEYITGLYWIDSTRDLSFSFSRIWKNPAELNHFFYPYFQPHVDAIFDWRDPIPFVKRWTGWGQRAIKPTNTNYRRVSKTY
jgi:predicted ATP-grasp superfamily ATP-dependent carboligase/O-antigen/teichoic acid export membrane protein